MANKILTRLAIAGWLLLLLGPLMLTVTVNRYTRGEWPFPPRPVHNSEFCQYPSRPLVDGQCNNLDPPCPETIKFDGGECSIEQVPVPVESAFKQEVFYGK